jgi:taurine transport system permease protein
MRSHDRLALKILSVVLLIGIWRFATTGGFVSSLFFPAPSEVLKSASSLLASGELWSAVLSSARRVFIGFGLAAAFAVPLGIVLGVWWPARALFEPVISLLRPLPSITWVPLTILWLGIGESQKVAIVFMGSWIYMLLYTLEATKRVDPLLIRAARNLGASDFAVMKEVILPGALPGILAGLKVTLAISWSCVITAEMVAAQTGLGALIWRAKDWGDLSLVLVGMLGISVTVLVADAFADALERRLIPWERHSRASRNDKVN